MVKVCPKCGTNDALSASGDLDSEIMTYECQNCGHSFQMLVIEIPVEKVEEIAGKLGVKT